MRSLAFISVSAVVGLPQHCRLPVSAIYLKTAFASRVFHVKGGGLRSACDAPPFPDDAVLLPKIESYQRWCSFLPQLLTDFCVLLIHGGFYLIQANLVGDKSKAGQTNNIILQHFLLSP